MKTLDELMALADEYVRTHMKHERAALESALRELIADAERYAFAKTMGGQVLVIDVFRNRGAAALDAAIDAARANE